MLNPSQFDKHISTLQEKLSGPTQFSLLYSRDSLLVGPNPEARAAQLRHIVDHIHHTLDQIFRDEIKLIVPWKPIENEDRYRAHFEALQIPTVDGQPSLLLHRLGEEGFNLNQDNVLRGQVFENVFRETSSMSGDTKHSVLFNTSGAGKTRLILEGLCRRWGFYITCKGQVSECGSADMERVLSPDGYLARLGLAEDPSEDENLLAQNSNYVKRCANAVLLSRCLVFQCLLMAWERNGYKTPLSEVQRKWLFIQLDTRLLRRSDTYTPDLFLEMTALFCHIEDHELLAGLVQRSIKECSIFLNALTPNTHIYCVLDEAQTAAAAFPKAFRGAESEPRPLLRQILYVWYMLDLRHVTTGTSLNIDDITEALSSTMGKMGRQARVKQTGAFVKSEGQIIRYLCSYLPPWHLVKDGSGQDALHKELHASGKELLSRAVYWLRGRPRFVASYVLYLILHNFRNPHQLLTQYIKQLTRFTPRDAQHWENEEGEKLQYRSVTLCPFDFKRATYHHLEQDFIGQIEQLTYYRLMNGGRLQDVETSLVNMVDTRLVECGFARYPGGEDDPAVVDEPLAYLAADFWITQLRKSRHPFIVKKIGADVPGKSNGLEEYTAFLLAHIFRDFTPLKEVFKFAEKNNIRGLSERRARLVSCWHDSSKSFRFAPVVFPLSYIKDKAGDFQGAQSSSNVFGCRFNDAAGDVEWLACNFNAPFLFPHVSFGPDLIFRLQLEGPSPEILTVAMQVKYRKNLNDIGTVSALAPAMKSITPCQFWIQGNGQTFAEESYPGLPQTTLAVLDNLPHRFQPSPDYHSVLRAMFVYPAVSLTSRSVSDTIVKVVDSPPVEKQVQMDNQVCLVQVGADLYDAQHEFCHLQLEALHLATKDLLPESALIVHAASTLKQIQGSKRESGPVRTDTVNGNVAFWPYKSTHPMSLKEFNDHLVLDAANLAELEDHKIMQQLALHRRIDKILLQKFPERGVPTPKPQLMDCQMRFEAALMALERWKELHQNGVLLLD